jgi:SulP family sulfate permease
VSDKRRSGRVLAVLTAGLLIGMVEVVLAIAFASFVFGGYLVQHLGDGIGLYLMAGTLTLATLAWRAGARGVVGSVQDAAAAILAIVSLNVAAGSVGSLDRAFITVVAATVVVTVLTGLTFLLLGTFRLGNLLKFMPYPVVGGFLAGTGWLLLKGGIGIGAEVQPYLRTIHQLTTTFELMRWIPAVLFGVAIYIATRLVKSPVVIPAALWSGLMLYVAGMVVTRSSIQDARNGLWLLGPLESTTRFQVWTVRSLTEADWSAVIGQAGGIATAVFVAVIASLFNVTGVELMLRTDLDSNRELRDVGVVNLISGPFGGIPGYHAVSLTSLAQQMRVGARGAGLVAALVPLTVVLFGGSIVELMPRAIVGGALVFLGLTFIVEWLIDVRRKIPLPEYLIIVTIFAVIAAKGYLAGVEAGLVLAAILFAINYSRVEAVREGGFGATYRSNVDRPPAERLALGELADRVLILRVHGFVFFGTASALVEPIRKRMHGGSLRFLLVDLRRVTGMDSSAVMAFRKVAQLAETNGFELVVSGVPDRVRAQLRRGGLVSLDGVVRFEPDLDHGLQWCEDRLLEGEDQVASLQGSGDALAGLPARLWTYFERRSLPEGTVLIRQGQPSDDLFVLESGRLRVEATTPEGTRMRLSSVSSGVMVGEIALYLGRPRTADVIAETPSVVLRLSRASIERMEAEEPELAAALHRWIAEVLAERASDSLRVFDALLE